MMSSKRTGEEPVGWRRSGAASTAQASDAQEARIARFSCVVISGSATTSMGVRKDPAGWRRQSRSKSFRFSLCMAISFEKRHGSMLSGEPPQRARIGHPSADRFRKPVFIFKSVGQKLLVVASKVSDIFCVAKTFLF